MVKCTSVCRERPDGRQPARLGAASLALRGWSSIANALISLHTLSDSGAKHSCSVLSGCTSHACTAPLDGSHSSKLPDACQAQTTKHASHVYTGSKLLSDMLKGISGACHMRTKNSQDSRQYPSCSQLALRVTQDLWELFI